MVTLTSEEVGAIVMDLVLHCHGALMITQETGSFCSDRSGSDLSRLQFYGHVAGSHASKFDWESFTDLFEEFPHLGELLDQNVSYKVIMLHDDTDSNLRVLT